MNTRKRFSWCFARMLACLLACCLQTSCTKSGEARTRAAQQEAFRGNFGFAAPASVTEIKYADHYGRGALDGDYEQWLRCTFQADVFDQMVNKKGYQKAGTVTLICDPNKPAWWPQGGAGGNVIYVRDGKDGPSYVEHLWHDAKTGFVYWHQACWD